MGMHAMARSRPIPSNKVRLKYRGDGRVGCAGDVALVHLQEDIIRWRVGDGDLLLGKERNLDITLTVASTSLCVLPEIAGMLRAVAKKLS